MRITAHVTGHCTCVIVAVVGIVTLTNTHMTLLCSSLQLFYRVTEEKARQAELYLVGMVCYYGKHYSTFFFQTKIRRWMYFDDAHVKEV